MNSKRKHGKVPEQLARLQKQFAAHLRNPASNDAPKGVEDRRMEIYRTLFFHNIRNFISNNFPVLRKLHSESGWNTLVREFYDEHRAHTPLFPEIPREFLQYLQDHRGKRAGDPPFMLELAHYEWVELALSLDEHEIDEVPADLEGDLLQGVPVLSPLAWPLAYRYPVHRIGPSFRPQEPPAEATHLLVYRNRADKVKFMQLNAISAALVHELKVENHGTGLDLLSRIAASMQHPQPELVLKHGGELLEELRSRDVILGTRPHT